LRRGCAGARAELSLEDDPPDRAYAPGGIGDFVGRLLAHRLSESFGHNVLVDNRPGVGVEITSRASPDGYTLVILNPDIEINPS
jgi:tripartite-type tricarboxylate transporter receptor subunit TctC